MGTHIDVARLIRILAHAAGPRNVQALNPYRTHTSRKREKGALANKHFKTWQVLPKDTVNTHILIALGRVSFSRQSVRENVRKAAAVVLSSNDPALSSRFKET